MRLAWVMPVVVVVLAGTPDHAQAGGGQASNGWAVPRTPSGQPDLQGVWDFATITPLERPAQFAGKEVLTAEESAAYEQSRFAIVDHDTDAGAVLVCAGTGNYNEFWYDRGYGDVVTDRRSSLILDPPDGQIPPLTAEAQRRPRPAGLSSDSWVDRGLGERCVIGFNAGPPMMPSAYNNNVQLFQAPGYVVIFNEMVHDARIVPLDGRSHVPNSIRLWSGDSRGHWEGDTLVVETANFSDRTSVLGSTKALRLTERFTRVDADILHYEFTVDDPTTFSSAWTAQVRMVRSGGPIFEYACHEGNIGLLGILAGARFQEAEARRGR
jgi:hypothetical protein